MELSTPPGAVCSTCNGLLLASSGCPACLLRLGLEEITDEDEETFAAASPVYGDFEIARREDGALWELGRGAMGVTYRAVDRVLHRAVALKVIQLGSAGNHDNRKSEALRERFLREARAAAALRHTNVAGIYQFGASDQTDRCFYAMELIEGETLETRVRRDGPLDVNTALDVARQVCAALVAAAGRGLIHRDLKPGNLMLTASSGGPTAGIEVKVIDFGLAKAAAAIGENELTHGGFMGTPAFASPEQFARAAVDARSDLYSLGVTLWYALTGRVPFTGRTLDELRDDPARAQPPVEQLRARRVPPCVVGLLQRILATDPADRPASARELLDALDACRQRLFMAKASSTTRLRLAPVIAVVLALAAAGGIWRWAHPPAAALIPRVAAVEPVMPPASGKSLAVLPFDNFSADKESAFFADGVQDEIITDLAKVADLKVISRSSVMQYRNTDARNLKEIGKALGVAYVVEGSVQRAGNKIKVTAQLIDAHTDAHQWAEQYVRDLADVFAIQGEIAQAIAGQLQAAVSPQERAAMEDIPTRDEQAYQLYLRARAVFNDTDSLPAEQMRAQALDLLKQATARDPNFARAFAFLAEVQFGLFGECTTPADGEAARGYAETAARLRPGSADASVAMGCYDYYIRRDYRRAHDEFAAAVRLAPNDERAYWYLGFIEERRGHWAEALAHKRRASELDPENNPRFWEYCKFLSRMGRTSEALALVDRRVASHPTAFFMHGLKAQILLEAKADTRAARAELALFPPEGNVDGTVTNYLLTCDIYERDFNAAARDLAACPITAIGGTSRLEYEADIARARGDAASATAAYTTLRSSAEQRAHEHPEDRAAWNNLALFDAWLGHKEAALEEGRHMKSLVKLDEAGTIVRANVVWAHVLTLVGERDEAIRTLQKVCGQPLGPTYGDLHEPDWDPLRNDSRFKAMEASLAPK